MRDRADADGGGHALGYDGDSHSVEDAHQLVFEVGAFLLDHDHFLQAFGEAAIDAAVLLLVGNRQREDFLRQMERVTSQRTINLLKAAANEPSVKSVVLTSSSSAALLAEVNKEIIVDESMWNHNLKLVSSD